MPKDGVMNGGGWKNEPDEQMPREVGEERRRPRGGCVGVWVGHVGRLDRGSRAGV